MNARSLPLLIPLLLMPALSQAYQAHEWGTFTSLVGSNGITQDGMSHEDEPLPPFVHGFGETQPSFPAPPNFAHRPLPEPTDPPPVNHKGHFSQEILSHNVVTQKMETPVIYFYSDVPQHVDVNVKFPEGVVTESYPAPVRTFPQMQDGLLLQGGDTTFSVDIMTRPTKLLVDGDDSNIYYHARNVQSRQIASGHEVEQFIFYRGLGRFQPALSITSHNGALRLSSHGKQNADSMPQAAFLVHVGADGDVRMLNLNTRERLGVDVSAETIETLADHTLDATDVLTGPSVPSALVAALKTAGLNPDEAQAMVDTWEHGYFHVPGLRLLYILPRNEIDRTLPVTMSPAPSQFTRVFVGRIEVMLDKDESRILARILSQRDAFSVGSLGRFAEPMLRRVLDVYSSQNPTAEGLALFNRLISRAATGSPASTSIH